MSNPWLAIIDPIDFTGGSKIASNALLSELDGMSCQVEVFTRNRKFWLGTKFKSHAIFEFAYFQSAEYGIKYFIKHALICLQMFIFLLVRKKPEALVGISGPGVDLSMYWLAKIFNIKTIQLIHGPVAKSKTIFKNIRKANLIACLESELLSVSQLVAEDQPLYSMINGIPVEKWPRLTCSDFETLNVFWAASLLRWKGLDRFIPAIEATCTKSDIECTVCYIKPLGTHQEVSDVPKSNAYIKVYEDPENLDELRAKCNIFVSTSKCEPFGLSILEAMAAGLCIVIPQDGSFWDKKLVNGVSCIKYPEDDVEGLKNALCWLGNNMGLCRAIAYEGRKLAEQYTAHQQYQSIVLAIHLLVKNESTEMKA